MSNAKRCEYCGRPIEAETVAKVIRGKRHTFCSEFCFRLHFYGVPVITYEDLQKMYAFYCISLPADEYRRTLQKMMEEEV
jgi:hypothetical protein